MQFENQEQKNKKLFFRVIFAGFILMLLTVSFWIGFVTGRSKSEDTTAKILPFDQATVINTEKKNALDFSLFWKTYEELKDNYVESDKLDAQKMLYGAIKGLLQSTGDPYTVYLDPEENKKFNQELSGNFEGIGAEMGIKQGVLTVIAPLVDSPAEKAGLRAGDKVIKINNEPTAEMMLDEAVNKIRGAKGTEVVLVIWRNGSDETQEVKIIRQVINVKSLTLEFKENDIAYVKITRFGEDTNREFTQAANQILAKKSKSLIIDLRNNPGGYLESAIYIASKMLSKDRIVVIEEGSKMKRKELKAQGGNVLDKLPVVIIINEGSASASEILAAALREQREDVVLIGKKTFGKGSVQEKIDLPQNTSAKITVARWLTPSGKQINNQGISPDIEVDLSNEDYENGRDPQLERALKEAKNKIGH